MEGAPAHLAPCGMLLGHAMSALVPRCKPLFLAPLRLESDQHVQPTAKPRPPEYSIRFEGSITDSTSVCFGPDKVRVVD